MTETAGTFRALYLVLHVTADVHTLTSCDYATVTTGGRLFEDLPAIALKAGQLVRLAVHKDVAQIVNVAKLLTDKTVADSLRSLTAHEVLALCTDYNAGLDDYQFMATISVPPGTERAVAAALMAAIQTRTKQTDDVIMPSMLAMVLYAPGVITLHGVSATLEWFEDFERRVLNKALIEASINPNEFCLVEIEDHFAVAEDEPCEYIASV